jgi:ATP-dependent protease ClpP protease subunit
MRNWYEIKAKANSADLLLYGDIGDFGIPASQFVAALAGLKGKTLNVFINSDGGVVRDGIAIYNALLRHDGPVNIVVDGIAASIASVIAQAGNTRMMSPGTGMMVHEAWGMAQGPTAEMTKMIEQLRVADSQIAGIYASKAGGTPEDWRGVMAAETWYTAQEAVNAGLADGIVANTPPVAATHAGRIYNLSRFKNVPDWVPQAAIEPVPYEAAPDETVKCPNCGLMNSPDAKYCDQCGCMLPVLAFAKTPPSVKPGHKPEGKEDDMDETAMRQALGLDAEVDIVGAIKSLKAANTLLQATIKSEAPEKGEIAQLRAELSETRQKLIATDNERNSEQLMLRQKVNLMEAQARVDKAISAGRITPANKDIALKVALGQSEEDFNRFVTALPKVDLTERGTGGNYENEQYEPTEADIAVAKQMGNWDESDQGGSRLALMRAKGAKIPAPKA